jgi:hypothetical protein
MTTPDIYQNYILIYLLIGCIYFELATVNIISSNISKLYSDIFVNWLYLFWNDDAWYMILSNISKLYFDIFVNWLYLFWNDDAWYCRTYQNYILIYLLIGCIYFELATVNIISSNISKLYFDIFYYLVVSIFPCGEMTTPDIWYCRIYQNYILIYLLIGCIYFELVTDII